jgi:hypothetical protein
MAKRNALTVTTKFSLAGFHTGITLRHRLPMLMAPWIGHDKHQTELNLMVHEKISALFDGALTAQTEALRLLVAAAAGKLDFVEMPHAPAAIVEASFRPAFRTVKANARRLNRRAW